MAYEKGVVQGTVVEMQPPPVARVVSVEGIDAIPSEKPSFLSTEYPSLIEMTNKFESDLGVSGTTVEVVDAACTELGVNRAGLSLVQKAERAWDIMYAGHDRPRLPPAAAAAADEPVDYGRLTFTSDVGEVCGEVARFLLDEGTSARNQFRTSKWNVNRRGRVNLEITVRGEPLAITRYALKSANDFAGRDPSRWALVGIAADGTRHELHRVDQRGAWGGQRWSWREWELPDQRRSGLRFARLRLEIEDNNGEGCTQLGQLRLWSRSTPPPPSAPLTVLVRNLAGEMTTLKCSTADPVSKLASEYALAVDLPPTMGVTLTLNGQTLEERDFLGGCGVCDGATLHAVVREKPPDPLIMQREQIFDRTIHANGGPRDDQNIPCIGLLCLPCNVLCPLHYLATCGCAGIVDCLTSLPCKFIPCSPCDPNSMDPLWFCSQAQGWAASHGQLHTLMVLAKNGADIEKYNKAGQNARTDAERERHAHVVKWIDEWRAVGSPKGCALPI